MALVPCTECGQRQRVRIIGNVRGQGQEGDITSVRLTREGLRYAVSLAGAVISEAASRDLEVVSLCGGYGGKPGVCAKGKDVARKDAPGSKKDATASGKPDAKADPKTGAPAAPTGVKAAVTPAQASDPAKAVPPGPAPNSPTPAASFMNDVMVAYGSDGKPRPPNKGAAKVNGISEDKSKVNVTDRFGKVHVYTHTGNGQWVHHSGAAAGPRSGAWLTAIVQSGGKSVSPDLAKGQGIGAPE